MLARTGSDPLTVAWAREHHSPETVWTVPAEVGRAVASSRPGVGSAVTVSSLLPPLVQLRPFSSPRARHPLKKAQQDRDAVDRARLDRFDFGNRPPKQRPKFEFVTLDP